MIEPGAREGEARQGEGTGAAGINLETQEQQGARAEQVETSAVGRAGIAEQRGTTREQGAALRVRGQDARQQAGAGSGSNWEPGGASGRHATPSFQPWVGTTEVDRLLIQEGRRLPQVVHTPRLF